MECPLDHQNHHIVFTPKFYSVSMLLKNMTIYRNLSDSVSTLQKNMSWDGHSVSMLTDTYRGLIFF